MLLLGLIRFGFRGTDIALRLVEKVVVDVVKDASGDEKRADGGLLLAVAGINVRVGEVIVADGRNWIGVQPLLLSAASGHS